MVVFDFGFGFDLTKGMNRIKSNQIKSTVHVFVFQQHEDEDV